MKKSIQLALTSCFLTLSACNKQGGESEMAGAVDDEHRLEEAGDWSDEVGAESGDAVEEAAFETADAVDEVGETLRREPDTN